MIQMSVGRLTMFDLGEKPSTNLPSCWSQISRYISAAHRPLRLMSHVFSSSQTQTRRQPCQLETFERRAASLLRKSPCRIVCESNRAPDSSSEDKSANPGNRIGANKSGSESSSGNRAKFEVTSKKGYFSPSLAADTVGSQVAPASAPSSTGFTLNPVRLLQRLSDIADEIQEKGMHKRRSFYSHDDWVVHRSSRRHAKHFLSSLDSRVIVSLLPPVCALTAFAAGVAAYNGMITSQLLSSYVPLLHCSPLPYELTAPALALLLVFRTEASYSRYTEARKTWTEVISSSKDLARQAAAWIQGQSDSRQKLLLLHYILAFLVALKCHLLYDSDMAAELRVLLDEDDLGLVLTSEHRPNCLIQLITKSLMRVQLEDNQRSLLDANISQFNASISICERLIRTPIPLSYTRLTSRFLVLWHLGLPIVLWDQCSWMVIPATFFSAVSLFCIEEVGVLIEEPFPMLALDRMCAKAHDNIRELVNVQIRIDDHLNTKAKGQHVKCNGDSRIHS